jgi:hypothetical protein
VESEKKSKKRLRFVLLIILIGGIVIAGGVAYVISNGGSLPFSQGYLGIYDCTQQSTSTSSGNIRNFHEGDKLELKENGDATFTGVDSTYSIGFTYEVEGNRITLTVDVLGSPYIIDGTIDGNTITVSDGAVLIKRN